jgi:hypothetical protein
MPKSTTFQGKPKPYGKPGHYYEPVRHAMQAKGLKTGTNIEITPTPKPIIDLGILPNKTYQPAEEKNVEELEKEETSLLKDVVEPEPQITYQPTEVGAEEIEIEDGEVEVKKPSKSLIQDIVAGFKAEKEAKGRALRQKAFTEVGREKEVDEEEGEEEPEFEGGGMRFGKILADLTGDYRSEDLVGLNDGELEELAVKYDSSAGGFLGKPQNPFLEELKKRITSREIIKLEKQKIDAELEEPRQRIRQEIAEIRKRTLSGDKGDFIERLLGV